MLLRFILPALLLMLSASATARAQHEQHIWYFGNHAGVRFDSAGAVGLTDGKTDTWEATSAYCNPATGALRLYTDGVSVWNQHHAVIRNGDNIGGRPNSAMGALIVPQPGSGEVYYIFTSGESESGTHKSEGIRYSIVDMEANGGDGEVSITAQPLLKPASEKIVAVSDADDSGYWIVTHEFESDRFHSWRLDAGGLNDKEAVISAVGPTLSSDNSASGYMAISPDGTRLAMTTYTDRSTYLFSFDVATGRVSNPVRIPAGPADYGICFSPNSTLLYVSENIGGRLRQYDVSMPDAAAIASSEYIVASGGSDYQFGALQLAPDGVIYLARHRSQYLAGILHPDAGGTLCTYETMAVDLRPRTCGIGLPNTSRRPTLLPPVTPPAPGAPRTWFFGYGAGIDFTGAVPIARADNALSNWEGTSVACDSAGHILFYTDGRLLFNRLHKQIRGWNGISSAAESSQGALIVRQPGSRELYHVFAAAPVEDNLYTAVGLRTGIVDMSLNGGFGGVSSPLVRLLRPASEKLQAVRHANGEDMWVIGHDGASNEFYAWLITASGRSSTPVVSAVGRAMTQSNGNSGCMKVSPNGRLLAMACYTMNYVALFDFDPQTGVVSNEREFPSGEGEYGVGFSPDSRVLYVSATIDGHLYQYDISDLDQTTTYPRNLLDTGPKHLFGALEIGPDGMLYVALNENTAIGRIRYPNVFGPGCEYLRVGVPLGGRKCGLQLPNLPLESLSPSAVPHMEGAGDQSMRLTVIEAEGEHLLLRIGGEETLSGELELFDCLGRLAARASFDTRVSSDCRLDVDRLTSGFYVARATAGRGTVTLPVLLPR